MKVVQVYQLRGVTHYRLECGHVNKAVGKSGMAAPRIGEAWPCSRCTPNAEAVMRAVAEKIPPLARDVDVVPMGEGNVRRQLRDIVVGVNPNRYRDE